MFKYALFLVVAFCAVQGFEARTVQYDDRSIEDVINVIKDVIQKIKDDIANIATQIPDLIKFIQDKITEVIENINLPGMIAKIKEEIEKIIALGEAGKKCVEAEREQIDGLIHSAQVGMDSCIGAAHFDTVAVELKLAGLVAKANGVREGISARVVKCVEDSHLNPITLFNCLKGQLDPINEEIAKLGQEIQATFAEVQEMAQIIGNSLASCVEAVRDGTVAKGEEILGSIKECVAGSV